MKFWISLQTTAFLHNLGNPKKRYCFIVIDCVSALEGKKKSSRKKAKLKTSGPSSKYYWGSFHSPEWELIENNEQRIIPGLSDLIKNPSSTTDWVSDLGKSHFLLLPYFILEIVILTYFIRPQDLKTKSIRRAMFSDKLFLKWSGVTCCMLY